MGCALYLQPLQPGTSCDPALIHSLCLTRTTEISSLD